MIKHIVCFKLKNNSPEECEKAATVLRSMEGNVPLLRGIEFRGWLPKDYEHLSFREYAEEIHQRSWKLRNDVPLYGQGLCQSQ